MSQDVVSRVERGLIGRMPLEALKGIIEALDARLVLDIQWQGAALDRLLDERHAAIVGWMTAMIERFGWQIVPEVSYSHYGERGSIDLLTWHSSTRTLLVIEVKTELGSVEATLRKLDEKLRLSPTLARDRFGWLPRAGARVLVLPDASTPRRHVERHRPVLDAALPARGRAINAWLRTPTGELAGILFAPVAARAPNGALPRARVRRPTLGGDVRLTGPR